MRVLTIRQHDRFALRKTVSLAGDAGGKCRGLLIELSLGGCRISNLGARQFEHGETVKVTVAGYGSLTGQVRWTNPGMVGLRLVPQLRMGDMNRLLGICRHPLFDRDVA